MSDLTIKQVGFASTCFSTYAFKHMGNISPKPAMALVGFTCPEVTLGNHVKAKDLTLGVNTDTDIEENGWLNKLFVVVEVSDKSSLVLYKCDGLFTFYAVDWDSL